MLINFVKISLTYFNFMKNNYSGFGILWGQNRAGSRIQIHSTAKNALQKLDARMPDRPASSQYRTEKN
jgi:hypothetical protein